MATGIQISPSSGSSANFANTNLTFTGDRSHNTAGNDLQITTDNGLFGQSFFYMTPTLAEIGTANAYVDFGTRIDFQLNPTGTVQRISPTGVSIGFGGVDAQARLDVRAQGALSTDLAFRVRNSANTITTLASNGLGHIETRVNNSFHFKTSVIGSTNTISKGDFGGYENGMVVGHGNTMNPNVNMYIFGNNNSNGVNGNGIIVGYTNTNIFGNVFGASNTNKAGNTFGNSNAGTANVFGNNNSISVSNGHGGTAFVVGNFLQLPNNININDTIYFGVRSSLGEPHISMHHNNLGIGGVIPTLTNYDLNARGVFYAQIGTAPTTLAANTFGMYSADIVAGNAAPHFRTENGSIIKLYQNTAVTNPQGIADALTNLGVLASSTIVPSGYTLTLGHSSNTMSRNTTWTIGGLTYTVPSAANVGSRKVAVPKSGVIKKVSIMTNVNGVSSSASPSPTIQLFNNTTSTATTITGTNLYSGTTPFTRHDIYTISATVTEGDEICVQAIIGNVTTEPTQVVMLIQLWIEEI